MLFLMFHDVRDDIDEYQKRYEMDSYITFNQFSKFVEDHNDSLLKFEKNYFLNANILKDQSEKIILTFDDGLKDHLQVARFLNKKGIKAIFFIPYKAVIEKEIILSHKIQFLLSKCDNDTLVEELIRYSGFDKEYIEKKYAQNNFPKSTWTKEMVIFTRFGRENSKGRDLVTKLFNEKVYKNNKEFFSNFYLDKKDLYEISELGHIIGGHGYLSENINYLENTYIEAEKSSELISIFNQESRLYSYPNGGHNKNYQKQLIKFGFDLSFTTIPGNSNESKGRFYINRTDGAKLVNKLFKK